MTPAKRSDQRGAVRVDPDPAPRSRPGALFSQSAATPPSGTEEIVREAQVTRGALYHHFGDKCDLFRTVHEGIERDLAERYRRAARRGRSGPAGAPSARRGRASSMCALDPAFARIVAARGAVGALAGESGARRPPQGMG